MRSVYPISLVVVVGMLTVLAFGIRVTQAEHPVTTEFESRANGVANLQKVSVEMLKAQAAMVQAVSTARKASAETQKLLQEVRGMDLDNQLKTTETFFEKRNKREEYLARRPRKRPDYETLVKICNARRPSRLVKSQFDASRGKIYWPEVLQRGEFEEHRKELEALFILRGSQQFGPGSEICTEVQKVSRQMRSELRTMVRDVHQMDYVAAKNFISGLAYEVQLPPNIEGLAAR